MKQQIAVLAAIACLAGCTGFDTVAQQRPSAVRPLEGKTKMEARSLSFKVNAPPEFATGDRIVNSNVSGIIAAGGGNIIAAGGGNIIAAGGGNIIAAGGGNYRVAAKSVETFRPVDSAVFHVENAKGDRISEYFKTLEDGTIKIENVPDGELLFVVARFEVEGEIYRVATPVPTGPIDVTWFVDPINTMIMAKLKVGAKDGKRATLALSKLAEIWGICNDAGVGLPVDALAADKEWTALKDFYLSLVGQIEKAEQDGTVEAGSSKKLENFLKDLDD